MSAAILEPRVQAHVPSQQELHWNAVRTGVVTILDLFDVLPWFKGAADWTAWRAFLCAIYGLPMTPREHEIFKACTGRQTHPRHKVSEAWVIVGRRGRKSAIGATIAVFEGAYREHTYLAKGETARIPIISKDKDDAKQIKDYAAAILADPSMAHLVGGEIIGETIPLSNNCEIRIKAASLTAGRSRTIPCALYDELAFWPSDDSRTPDEAIIRGVTPAMATVPGALQVGMSSPYAKRGVLWDKFKEFWGKESDDVLVWKAPTLLMHDTPQIRAFVRKEYELDETAARAEIGADFRDDIQNYLSEEKLALVTAKGVTERPYDRRHTYFAFTDPSGGLDDSMTMAISHFEGKVAVLDYVQEWKAPFNPKLVVPEQVAVMAHYRVKVVTGDHYAGEWPAAEFRANRVRYQVAEMSKNELYRELISVFSSMSCLLLDHPTVQKQFLALERHVRAGGRDVIDHPPKNHDDVANAVAGAILLADRVRPKERVIEEEPTVQERELIEVHKKLRERIRAREAEARDDSENERRSQERGGEITIGMGGL